MSDLLYHEPIVIHLWSHVKFFEWTVIRLSLLVLIIVKLAIKDNEALMVRKMCVKERSIIRLSPLLSLCFPFAFPLLFPCFSLAFSSKVIADYEEDFIRLFGEDDLGIVKACFRSVANYVGSPSKNSSVVPAPTTPVHHKINKVFSRLEQWKLLFRSEQRGVSPEQSHRYLPKRYLFDTGILRHYREAAVPSIGLIDSIGAELRKPLGGIVENQVAIELARKTAELNGWKKSPSGMEIDFILRVADMFVPIECKATTSIKKTHLKGILSYLKMYNQKKGLVISLAPYKRIDLPDGIEIVNIPLYMAEFMDKM